MAQGIAHIEEINQEGVTDQFAEYGLDSKQFVEDCKKILTMPGKQFHTMRSSFGGVNFKIEIETEDPYTGRFVKASIFRLEPKSAIIVAQIAMAQNH